MTGLRTRIAPTPSGYLHLGNAYSFILTWLVCRAHNGTLRLRIDDLDAARVRPNYVEDVFKSLDWLGIDYDEGPTGPDDHYRRCSQSLRLDQYRATLRLLVDSGDVFACRCSRRDILAAPGGRHPTSCRARRIALEHPGVAWRVQTAAFPPVMWRDVDGQDRHVALDMDMTDFVVRRKDGLPAYQIASLTDDLEQGINFIVRGEDLMPSTAAQRLLAGGIRGDTFLEAGFLHHPLLEDPQGGKLSKSAGASSLRAMRAVHDDVGMLYRQLSIPFGVEPVSTLEELREAITLGWEFP